MSHKLLFALIIFLFSSLHEIEFRLQKVSLSKLADEAIEKFVLCRHLEEASVK